MEENILDLHPETDPLSLKDFGVISIASRIWDVHFKNLKESLITLKDEKTPSYYYLLPDCDWLLTGPYLHKMKVDIMKIIQLKLNLKCLPKVTATAIQTKVLELCDQLDDWTMYVTKDLNFHTTYVDKIFFTSKGEIDTSRIFRLHWMNIPSIEPTGWFFLKFKPLHLLACLFDPDYLSHFQTDIIKEIESAFRKIKIDHNSDPIFRITSIVIYCYKAFLERRCYGLINANELNETRLTASVMLEICVDNSFYKPFVYFYNRLNATQEYNFLDSISRKNLEINFDRNKYGKERRGQIAVFLLKKMNDFQKSHFIWNNYPFLFFYFLGKESYQKFCIQLLDKCFLRYSQNFNAAAETILKHCYHVLAASVKLGINSRFHVQVFQSLIKNTPKDIKFNIFSSYYMNIMYHDFCTPALRTIINDPDLENVKAELIKKGETKFKTLIEQKNYKEIDRFVVEVLSSKALHDEFNKTMSSALGLWIMNFHFEFVDNYLTWKYAERARKFKTQLHPFWCSLAPKIYENIERLFMWCFDKEEMPTVKNCFDRELALLKQFCQELVYTIWFCPRTASLKYTPYSCSSLSTQILNSVFISEEEVAKYKKYELANGERCVKWFCENVLKNNAVKKIVVCQFEALDNFFEFCTLTKDEINEIKKSIDNDMGGWIIKYGVDVNRFDIVVPLLEWVYGYNNDNREILLNYFDNSDKLIAYYENRYTNSD